MKVYSLTGGMGMGKSAVAELLRRRGIPVADADEFAHRLVEPGEPALEEIAGVFGRRVISPEGRLRRQVLADIVFSDSEARSRLEQILHPRIRRMWREQIAVWQRASCERAVVVVPLLYEICAEADFDAVICVACTAETQYARLRARGWTDTQIEQRLQAQLPIEEKMTRADYVIWTEGELDVVSAQLDLIFSTG